MQDQLNERVNALNTAEKELVTNNLLQQMRTWARLLDEVGVNLHLLVGLNNSESSFNQSKQQFEHSILNNISNLNIANDSNSYQRLTDACSNYRQYYNQLVEIKMKILAINNDLTDIDALKKVVSDAKNQRIEFEKSFAENIQKQTKGSTRTLAKYFDERLKKLKDKDNKLTNPDAWAQRRSRWLWSLIVAILVFGCIYLFLISAKLIAGYEWQVLFLKVTVLAVFYLQYHFATKNYHIYADLVARYEHLSVISKTMTDFSAAAYEDEILRESVLSNASKTLFADISTGHMKNAEKESSVFENIINQIPKSV